MKTVYLIKSGIYFGIGVYYYSDKIEVLLGFTFLAIIMLFFWLELSIKDYIDELKNK